MQKHVNDEQANENKSGAADANLMSAEQKLALAERANEIYRQQLKYMQDHLASLRSLIQDKENIIENLMLRYDLGILVQDPNQQNNNVSSDDMPDQELRRKAEGIAQRTILENFELRVCYVIYVVSLSLCLSLSLSLCVCLCFMRSVCRLNEDVVRETYV